VSTASAPEGLLRAHARSILDRASIPESDREDLAEEMYGHLWLRWQEELKGGEDPSSAAQRAIGSFGDATSLAREITGAFHSRLYSATIGTLLPKAVDIQEESAGQSLLRVFFVALVLRDLVMVRWSIGSLTLVPVVVTLGILGFAVIVAAVAAAAVGRAQRWPGRVALPVVGLCLVEGFAGLISGPGIRIDLMAVIALITAAISFGPEPESLLAGSSAIGRPLQIVLTTALVGGFLVPQLTPSIPDPTLIGPSDVSVEATVTCGTGADGQTTMVVDAGIIWHRLDPWLDGQEGVQTVGDLAASMDGAYDGLYLAIVPTPAFDVSRYVGATVDVNSSAWPFWSGAGADPNDLTQPTGWMPGGGTSWSGGYGQPGGYQIDRGSLEAGRRYDVQWSYAQVRRAPDAPYPPMAVVSYAHMDRFLIQAVATCDEAGRGVPVAPLIP
jgi:hypothetical protein